MENLLDLVLDPLLDPLTERIDALAGVDALAAISNAREALKQAERRALVRARHEALRVTAAGESTSWTVLARRTGLAIPPIRRRVLAAEEALSAEDVALEQAVATCRATSDVNTAVTVVREWNDPKRDPNRRVLDAFAANDKIPAHIRALAKVADKDED